jgi:hypothetical protein
MSNPQPDRLKKRPRRAAPLQPDNPGSGAETIDAPDTTTPASPSTEQKSAEQLKRQSETARQNVSEGYD